MWDRASLPWVNAPRLKETSMTSNLWKGIVAGFVATVALSALFLVKSTMGVMPELDVIAMLTKMMGASSPIAGWVAHFMIGAIIFGAAFAWLANNHIPGGGYWLKGIVFGIGAWILMMVAVMPMAGAGLFGMNMGIMAPVMTLMLHIIYGAVLGAVYGAEKPERVFAVQASPR